MTAYYIIKWANLEWEKQQAFKLREQVFCREQGLFATSDLDAIDQHAQSIVAIACQGGSPDQIVGTVRIHHQGDHVWWGSRLAVCSNLRHSGGIGAALIRLAVTSAHGKGCRQFLAQVQAQNETLFQRLHWHTLEHLYLHQRLHAVMEADLQTYPPCLDPMSGFVVKGKAATMSDEIAPSLMRVITQPTGNVHYGAC